VPARRAQVVPRRVDARLHGVEHAQRLLDDLDTDAVARDNSKSH